MENWKAKHALDRLDACIASLVNLRTLRDEIHVKALREQLPEIAAELRAALEGEAGQHRPAVSFSAEDRDWTISKIRELYEATR